VSAGPLLAAGAAAAGVAGAWEALAAVEALSAAAAVRRALAPLARAGREGREPSAPERRRLVNLSVATLLIGGWLIFSPWLGLLLAAAAPSALTALVRARRRRHAEQLERSAPAAARALADALAAGRSVRGAIAEAASTLEGPAARELRASRRALDAGEETEIVLDRLRRRAEGRAWSVIVAAVLVQRHAGGDLARVLRGIAAAHEETLRIEHDARAATAQARFTGLLVCGLPLGAAALAELASPGYLGSLVRAPLSAALAGVAFVLQLFAALSIRRFARVAR
jgi:tight adherence protein B